MKEGCAEQIEEKRKVERQRGRKREKIIYSVKEGGRHKR
jgi:hypothetical protein